MEEDTTSFEELADIVDERATRDPMGTMALAILCCAKAIDKAASKIDAVANQLKWLGTGDAATHMGAIEALAAMVKETGESLSSAVSSVGEAIANHE